MPSRLRVRERFGEFRRRGTSAERSETGALLRTGTTIANEKSVVDERLDSDDDSTPMPEQPLTGTVPRRSSNQSAESSSTNASHPGAISRSSTLVEYTPQAIWNEALASAKISEEHRKILKGNVKSGPCDSDSILQAVTATLREVENKRWVNYSYTWNGKTYKIFKLLDNVTLWIERFKSIGDIIIQYQPVYTALPWAAVRMLLQVAVEDKANMAAIALVVERATNLVAACSMYIEMYLCEDFDFAEMLKDAIVQLYTEILYNLALAMGYFNHTCFRTARSLLDLQSFKDSLTNIDKKMNQVKEVVQLAQSVVQNTGRIAQRDSFIQLQQKLTGLGKSLTELGLNAQELLRDMTEKNQDAFHNWLSPCAYISHHLDQGEGILENTGTWLFDRNTQYKNWVSSEASSVLWVKGNPGVGKTRLTYAGIEVAHKKASTGEFVIYFYCSRGEDARRHPEIILGTLIKQILYHLSRSTPQALHDRYQARSERGALRVQELQHWLCFLLRGSLKTTILIDAVDEIFPEKRQQFLEVLRSLMNDTTLSVKIWISSREETDIQLTFTEVEEVIIYRQHEAEIRSYVEREISKHIQRKTLLYGEVDTDFKNEIVHRISEKSEGMFLWAHLQVEGLKRLNRRKHVEQRLNTLPKDLTATYNEIYQTILDEEYTDDREAAKMALRWVMVAVRPLSPEEWAHAAWLSSTFISTDAETTGIDDAPDIKPLDLQNLCHSFISVDNQLNVVRFAHLSVREYLERSTSFMEMLPDYMASQTCLAYLSRSKSITGPFSRYIISNWSVHCRNVTERPNTDGPRLPQGGFRTVLGLVRNFLQPNDMYRRWLAHVNDVEFCKDIDPLFVAARYGLAQVCKDMLSCSDQSPVPRNMDRRTPLHAAAQFGHSDVVKLYMNVQNVDVNDMDKDGRTPLAWAVFCEHQSVVKILLMTPRVKVNIADRLGKFTPLTRASWRGSLKMVKILAEVKAIEIDKRDGFGMTALMWASRRGDTPVMAALMERGADVNARDNYNRTALHWALISKELDAFAQLTKDSRVNVNCTNVNGMTPLFYACKYRYGKILDRTLKRLLVVKGIDVNAPCHWETPLIVAADAGQNEAIRRLTKAENIKVNEVGLKGQTALIIATIYNQAECVHALIETARGLDLGHEDALGKTALVYAVEKGFEDITKQLLEAEGIELTGSSGLQGLVGNADLKHQGLLSVARKEPYAEAAGSRSELKRVTVGAEEVFNTARRASQGVAEAQEKLIQIDINALGICGETALHLSARSTNKLEVARTLLSVQGIIPDKVEFYGKTPLSEAARLGNVGLVSILLKTPGVNPNAEDIRGRTPLFLSTRDKPEHRDIVEILLQDPRTNVNATDKNGITPISQAVHNEALEVAELLLTTGHADVNLVDYMGFTPLHNAAMKGQSCMLELLLNVPGIDIECQDDRWYTPLALAAKFGHKDAVSELVKKGANLLAQTNRGLTPLELAEEYGHVEIVELLNNAG